MNEKKPSTALIDLLASAISPVLVMMMVGSLTFFLIEVLYHGPFTSRLYYIFFFFVIGAVLIARITIQLGRATASIYAAGLGIACFLAMMMFVEYPPGIWKALAPVLNIALMGLVWWSAHKLTWDCTHLDEDRKTSGRGVLAAAGLDEEEHTPPEVPEEPVAKPKKKGKAKIGYEGWLERFNQYRKEQKLKPHTPGVWVLYFSLAALPLFALGQSLIAPGDAERRRATFLEMGAYIGSGLALLVTTSLMGLRRYLEQRGSKVPTVLTMSWLGLGGGLIVLFLLVGAVLPKPYSDTPWFGIEQAGGPDRKASNYAMVKDKSAGKGKGAEGEKTEAGKGKNSAKGGEQNGGKKGEKGSGGDKSSDQSGGKSKGNNQSNKSNDNSKKTNDQSNSKDKSNDSKSSDPSDKKSDDNEKKSEDGSNSGEEAKEPDQDPENPNENSDSPASRFSQAMESISGFIKWLVWIVIAIAVIAGIAFFFLKWLSPFTNWAKNLLDWLRNLFARKVRERDGSAPVVKVAGVRRPSFSDFANPFAGGTASRKDPAELVEYTFEAFDAWAWDRDCGRSEGETPLEFAVRIGHEHADLDEPAFATAELVARAVYSDKPLPGNTLKILEDLWDQLESAPRPGSR